MAHLTTDNCPQIVIRIQALKKEEFEYLDGEKLIKGKSLVLNAAGMIWLYMSDDHRKNEPDQIIVKEPGISELAFLPINRKRAIRLTQYKHSCEE